MLEGMTHETRATIESMYYAMCYSTIDDMWDLFESLAWHQWKLVDARALYHRYHSYPHVLCSYCQSFDHNVHLCPYYDISDECYAILSAMIETMYDRHMHFVSELRECGLLHETDPISPSPRLEVSLYNDTSLPFP